MFPTDLFLFGYENDFVTLWLAAPFYSDFLHINAFIQALTWTWGNKNLSHEHDTPEKSWYKVKVNEKVCLLICGRCKNMNL